MNEDRSTGAVHYQRVISPHGLVEFADVGHGPPILYFHGSGAGADAVVAVEQPLIDDGFRLIVPHRPGYFGTPLDDNRTSNDCAVLSAKLLDSLGIERAAVIGMSSGGMAAITFAQEFPEKTAALVLQCALTHPLSAIRWMPRRFSWTFPFVRHPRIGRPFFRFAYQFEINWVRWNPNHLVAHTAGERKSQILERDELQILLPRLVEAATACAVAGCFLISGSNDELATITGGK